MIAVEHIFFEWGLTFFIFFPETDRSLEHQVSPRLVPTSFGAVSFRLRHVVRGEKVGR